MRYAPNRLMRDRRPTGVVMAKAFSIYNQCRECCGWEGDPALKEDLNTRIAGCTATLCGLHGFRLQNMRSGPLNENKLPLRASQEMGNPILPLSSLEQDMGFLEPLNAQYGRPAAIKRFCMACQCIEAGSRNLSAIRECTTKECWLWPHRPGVKVGSDE